MIRFHQGQRDLVALPVYAPADAEIGRPEIPAVSDVRRDFVHEQQILRREERTGGRRVAAAAQQCCDTPDRGRHLDRPASTVGGGPAGRV